jgi:hypothetical protein
VGFGVENRPSPTQISVTEIRKRDTLNWTTALFGIMSPYVYSLGLDAASGDVERSFRCMLVAYSKAPLFAEPAVDNPYRPKQRRTPKSNDDGKIEGMLLMNNWRNGKIRLANVAWTGVRLGSCAVVLGCMLHLGAARSEPSFLHSFTSTEWQTIEYRGWPVIHKEVITRTISTEGITIAIHHEGASSPRMLNGANVVLAIGAT